MNRIRLLLILGFFATLLLWLMPARFKPYHIKHDFQDYKILLVELDSEWGLASDGVVRVNTMLAYGVPQGGKHQLLNPVRQDYIANVEQSNARWPIDTRKVHYDEWGPSRTTLDSGVERTLQGNVYCVPYSLVLIVFGIPLLWDGIRQLVRHKRQACERPVKLASLAPAEPAPTVTGDGSSTPGGA